MTRDLLLLQYNADIVQVLEILKKWRTNSKNPELVQFTDAMLRINKYVNAMQLERTSFDRIISEQRADKLRAIDRATRAENELNEIIQKS